MYTLFQKDTNFYLIPNLSREYFDYIGNYVEYKTGSKKSLLEYVDENEINLVNKN